MSALRRCLCVGLVAAAAGWGCSAAEEPGAARARRALAGGDSAADAVGGDAPDLPALDLASDLAGDAAPPGCGGVTKVGCCDGETLWWCGAGGLKSESCVDKPSCGWNTAGFYDCNTSGAADPAGVYPLPCADGDGGVPPSDQGGGDAAPCGGVPEEGCCASGALRYCEGGVLKVLSCAFNPTCGWYEAGKRYDCGTTGAADPSGAFPMLCPGALPVDGSVDQGDDAQAPDLGGDGGAPPDGCGSCGAGGAGEGAGPGGAAWALALLALLWLLRRRASA